MKKTLKLGLVAVTALTGLVALAPVAGASSNGIGGFGGRPQSASTAGCFSENYGAVVSSCSSIPAWEISMPANSPGSVWTPNLHVRGNGFSNTITCGVDSVSTDGMSISTSPQQTASNAQQLNYSIWVPMNGYLFAACYMGAGTEWYSVNY